MFSLLPSINIEHLTCTDEGTEIRITVSKISCIFKTNKTLLNQAYEVAALHTNKQTYCERNVLSFDSALFIPYVWQVAFNRIVLAITMDSNVR